LHRFDKDQECDGRPDGQTPGRWLRRARHYMLSRVKRQSW